MRKKYNNEFINEVINKFKELNSYKKTADYFNIPLSSCKTILNRNNFFVGGRKLKITNKKYENIVKNSKILLSKNKYSFNNLCKELKVKPQTFRNFILKNKIKGIIEYCDTKNKKQHILTSDIKKKIISLEKKGLGNDSIGKRLGINGSTVRKYLIEYYGKEIYSKRHSIEKFFTPNYSGFLNNRGDRFHSSLESLVADYLYENNIKYKTQHYIKFKNGKSIYPDFYLEDFDLYIEVFGMSEIDFYIQSMLDKINLYKKYNYKLLGLFYKNFKENNWKEVINKNLNL